MVSKLLNIQFYEAIEDKQDGVPSLEALWSKNWRLGICMK